MRWYNKLKLVFRIYTRRIFVTLLLFGMSYMAFYMTDRVVTKYIGDRYDIWQVERSFSVNPDDSGFIYFVDREQDQTVSSKVCEYMKQLKDIDSCGYFISTSLVDGDIDNGDYIGAYIIDKDIIDIGNLKLDQNIRDKVDVLKDDEKIVLLGNFFRKRLNKDKVMQLYEGDEITVVQADGCLKAGARWIHEDKLFGASFGAQDNYVLDDNAVIIIGSLEKILDSEVYSNMIQNICFKCKDGMFENVTDDIKNFCYEEGINISVINYGDEIKQQYIKSNIIDDNNTFTATVMIVVLAVIAISISNIMYCIMSKMHYGIMMSTGMSKRDIMWIVTAQNMIVLVLAGVGAWCIRIKMLFGTFFPKEVIESTGRYYEGVYAAHTYYMPFILIIEIIVVMLISNIIPYIIIRWASVTDMLEGRDW